MHVDTHIPANTRNMPVQIHVVVIRNEFMVDIKLLKTYWCFFLTYDKQRPLLFLSFELCTDKYIPLQEYIAITQRNIKSDYTIVSSNRDYVVASVASSDN